MYDVNNLISVLKTELIQSNSLSDEISNLLLSPDNFKEILKFIKSMPWQINVGTALVAISFSFFTNLLYKNSNFSEKECENTNIELNNNCKDESLENITFISDILCNEYDQFNLENGNRKVNSKTFFELFERFSALKNRLYQQFYLSNSHQHLDVNYFIKELNQIDSSVEKDLKNFIHDFNMLINEKNQKNFHFIKVILPEESKLKPNLELNKEILGSELSRELFKFAKDYIKKFKNLVEFYESCDVEIKLKQIKNPKLQKENSLSDNVKNKNNYDDDFSFQN